MATLIFNNTNVVQGSSNSRYQLNFPSGGIVLKKGDQLGIQHIQIPYSWFNLTGAYNNKSFGYKLNGTLYTLNLQDGFYTMDDINNALIDFMVANGHYLVNASGNKIFYSQLSTNQNLYAIQYDAFVIPSSLPTGFTNPANVLYNTVPIASPTTIQLVIFENNFTKICGFSAGSFPSSPQSSVYSAISSEAPNLTPVNSLVMRCSLCSNIYSNPPDAFYSFAPNCTFGSNIVIDPSYPCWLECKAGSFQSIEIQFVDQNFQPVILRDNAISIQLLIKTASK